MWGLCAPEHEEAHATSVSVSGDRRRSPNRKGQAENEDPGRSQRRRWWRCRQNAFRFLGGKSDNNDVPVDQGHELSVELRESILPAGRLVFAGFLYTATAVFARLVVGVPRVFVVRAAEELKSWHGSKPAMRGQWHPNQGHYEAHYSTERPHNGN